MVTSIASWRAVESAEEYEGGDCASRRHRSDIACAMRPCVLNIHVAIAVLGPVPEHGNEAAFCVVVHDAELAPAQYCNACARRPVAELPFRAAALMFDTASCTLRVQ
jgi:hypothetical protein